MDMTASYVREDLRALSEVIQFAGSSSPGGNAGDEVLKAALELILDDAAGAAESHFENELSPADHVGRR
jgi:hypothetical protein